MGEGKGFGISFFPNLIFLFIFAKVTFYHRLSSHRVCYE